MDTFCFILNTKIKQGGKIMKTIAIQNTKTHQCANLFPNAADRRYFLNKILDSLLVGVIGMGIAASILFLIALC